jgi:hypothetical protein
MVMMTLVLAGCSGGDDDGGDAAVRAESLGDATAGESGESGGGGSSVESTDGDSSDGSASDEDPSGGFAVASDDEVDDVAEDEAPVVVTAEGAAEVVDNIAKLEPEELNEAAFTVVEESLVEDSEELTGEDLEEHLASRYEAYWYAFDLARRSPSASPETDYPILFSLAAGEQLESAFSELKSLSESGDAIREPSVPAVAGLDADSSRRVRIDSIEDGVAEVVACSVYDNIRYSTASGEIVDQGVRSVETTSTMARHEGEWKVIRSSATGLSAGVGGCWNDAGAYPL